MLSWLVRTFPAPSPHLPRWREGAGPALRALPFSQQRLLSSPCALGADPGAGADPGLRQNPCPRVDVLHLVRGRVAPEQAHVSSGAKCHG